MIPRDWMDSISEADKVDRPVRLNAHEYEPVPDELMSIWKYPEVFSTVKLA